MRIGLLVLLLILIYVIVFGSAILVPIVGINRAVRRRQHGERSTGAVTWSGINVAIFGMLTLVGISTGAFHPIAPGGLVLNGLWLALAVRTNRAAGTPARPRS
jgi:hypothetical protein